MSDSGRRGNWVFPAAGQSAAEARNRVERMLQDLPRDSLEVALLLTSELVTNAVRHGAGPVTVDLASDGAAVRIGVHDLGATLPVARHPDADSLGGRGLLLVEGLAAGWGVDREARGKTVWFTLRP